MGAFAAAVLALAVSAPPALGDLLARAGARVERLKDQLSVVIADERYDQHAGSLSRRMKSEMLFLWLEDDRFWVGIRNVLEVDGRKIPDSRQRLDRILKEPAPDAFDRLQRVGAEGARFNIGGVVRTTNSPTLVLQFLLPETQARFDFTRLGREQVRDEAATVVGFAERRPPSVITYNGRPILSSGRVWLRDADGAVLRTELTLAGDRGLSVRVTVEFKADDRLGVLVPARMDERYEAPGRPRTTCTATYSRYRRFETSARLLVPGN